MSTEEAEEPGLDALEEEDQRSSELELFANSEEEEWYVPFTEEAEEPGLDALVAKDQES